MAQWRPIGQTSEDAEALHEGVPPWAKEGLWDWIDSYLSDSGDPQRLVDVFEQLQRAKVPLAGAVYHQGTSVLKKSWDGETVIRFLDFLVMLAPNGNSHRPERLDHVLERVGSAWKVGTRDGFPGLERRVPEGVQAAADQAMATPGHAGARLSEAWHAVYGVNPDPTKAYALAVRAVEDATIPAVVPRQGNATLSHVIGQLVNDGNWSLPLTREDPNAPTAQTVINMVKALWKGHHDRHGGVPNAPATVNQDEAEAAVHLAVFLVQGFASGLIARR